MSLNLTSIKHKKQYAGNYKCHVSNNKYNIGLSDLALFLFFECFRVVYYEGQLTNINLLLKAHQKSHKAPLEYLHVVA